MTQAQRLSTLWIVVMLNMGFADILSLYLPGMIDQVSSGVVEGVTLSPMFLALAAVFIEIGILMILATKCLSRPRACLANLVAAPVMALFVIGGGSTAPHYLIFGGVEVVALVMIFFGALTWRDGAEA